MQSRVKTYQAVGTLGKSPIDLVIQVYDGVIRGLDQGAAGIARAEFQNMNEGLDLSRRCITHLYGTLDPVKGGEIAVQLESLYAFALGKLDEAAATKNQTILTDLGKQFRTLREGWLGIRDQEKQRSAPAASTEQPTNVLISA